MKKTIKYGFGILLTSMLIYSCSTNNTKTGYVPATYIQPQTFTMMVDTTTASDNNFDVTYTSMAKGKGYYAVLPASATAPTSTQIFNDNVNGSLQSGEFALDGSTPVTFTVNNRIYGDHTYKVYAINESTDNFISETVTSTSFTTPDTVAPAFLADTSVPANQSGYADPTNTHVAYLNFTEPVYYNAGDVTVTAFYGGTSFTVSGASNFTQVDDVNIAFDLPNVLSEDDFYIISFPADTFRDASGKPVPALAMFDYYWATDHYSTTFEMNQIFGESNSKDFDYVLTDNVGFAGLGLPIPLTGTYAVKRVGDTVTLFNALDETYGDASYAYKVKFKAATGHDLDGPDPQGEIYLIDNPQKSVFTSGGIQLFWNAWYDYLKPALTGYYNTADSSIKPWFDFGDYNGYNGSNYFGDNRYSYTPTASTPPVVETNQNIKLSNVIPSVKDMSATKSELQATNIIFKDKSSKTSIIETSKPKKEKKPIAGKLRAN